jgi:hypothetical protein
LITSGTELLLEEGLGTGADHLTFKRVFQHLEATAGIRLTNASVIGRIWDSQQEFQTEVLAVIADNDSQVEIDRTLESIGHVLDASDRSTPEARLAALREICRLGSTANLDAVVGSPSWPAWIGVWALVMADADTIRKRPIADALQEGFEATTRNYQAIYEALLTYFGLRPRDPLTTRQFTVAVDALAEGCALRDSVDPASVRAISRPTGPDGDMQEWTLFGIGLDALVHEFFELDPAWELS